MNFGTQTYQGREVLTWGQTPGEYVIFDKSYREIASFRAANGYNGDHHEFLISPQDTALISIYDAVPRDLTSFGGPKDGVAIQGIIQELNIETGGALRMEKHRPRWSGGDLRHTVEDHYPGIDYFHLNSIDVGPDNNLLISARETSTVYKIDRNSGRIIWRLGGKKSDFEMGPGARFAFQHDADACPTAPLASSITAAWFRERHPQGGRRVPRHRARPRRGADARSLVREYTHPDGNTPMRQGTRKCCRTVTYS